jgi:hypothetical protein
MSGGINTLNAVIPPAKIIAYLTENVKMLTAPTSPAATLYAIKVHRFLEVHV